MFRKLIHFCKFANIKNDTENLHNFALYSYTYVVLMKTIKMIIKIVHYIFATHLQVMYFITPKPTGDHNIKTNIPQA